VGITSSNVLQKQSGKQFEASAAASRIRTWGDCEDAPDSFQFKAPPSWPCYPCQVFEYLTTDLKKYMDRNGKGPAHPLSKPTVKAMPTVHDKGAGQIALSGMCVDLHLR
jgi:hypothetical protein